MTKRFWYAFAGLLVLVALAAWLHPAAAAMAAIAGGFVVKSFGTYESRRRYQSVIGGIKPVLADTSVELKAKGDPDKLLVRSFKELAAELERKNFQLVEKNIQLLSLKEIGLTLISSLDEKKVVDAVVSFLSKGLGFRELFVAIYHDDRSEFNVYRFRDAPGGYMFNENTMPIGEANGLFRKVLHTRQSVLIRDPDMHPVGSLAGRPLFPDSTMNSYIVVPMIKSTATQDCGRLDDCVLKASPNSGDTGDPDEYRCSACGRVPVLGAIGVTDGYKAATMSKVDLVSIETLAVQISTMLENSRLFAELRSEEAFRQNIINSMMNGLVTCDTNGNVMLANESALELTGYTEDEIKRLNVGDLFGDNAATGEPDPVSRTLAKGRKVFQGEGWIAKKNGSRDPVILNTSFLYDESRNVQGALAVFLDIARIKRMEEQIVHLDKLAALGRFSSSIAHEIRNPLTGIAAGIQYLQRAGEVSDNQTENISFILEEVDRIDRLIGDLMNVVRVSDLILEETSLQDLVTSAVHSMTEIARKRGVTLRTEFDPGGPIMMVDIDRIKQVLINLVKNAIEASQQDGEVAVTVSYPSDVSDVLFDAVQDFAIIQVKDNGLGITEEDKKRIFEPFYSRKSTGTGLGLYVTHSIIERHNGYIYVDSEYGVGTIFTVYLPIKQVRHGDTREIGHPVS